MPETTDPTVATDETPDDGEDTGVYRVINILDRHLERQTSAIEHVPERIESMGREIVVEMREGLRFQTKWGFTLLALLAILLAAVAGAQVTLHWRGVGIEAHPPSEAYAAPVEPSETP